MRYLLSLVIILLGSLGFGFLAGALNLSPLLSVIIGLILGFPLGIFAVSLADRILGYGRF